MFKLQINEQLTTVSHTVGGCAGQVGTYSSSAIIMPNKLHFMNDLAKFKEFWKNPVGIITVAAILLVYFMILIWALKQDRVDTLMVKNLLYCNCCFHFFILLVTSFLRFSFAVSKLLCFWLLSIPTKKMTQFLNEISARYKVFILYISVRHYIFCPSSRQLIEDKRDNIFV